MTGFYRGRTVTHRLVPAHRCRRTAGRRAQHLQQHILFSKTPVNCQAPGPLADSGTSDAVWPETRAATDAVSAGHQWRSRDTASAPFSIDAANQEPGDRLACHRLVVVGSVGAVALGIGDA